jgi:hypothetical protein
MDASTLHGTVESNGCCEKISETSELRPAGLQARIWQLNAAVREAPQVAAGVLEYWCNRK